jgi:hypothetical protein
VSQSIGVWEGGVGEVTGGVAGHVYAYMGLGARWCGMWVGDGGRPVIGRAVAGECGLHGRQVVGEHSV